MYMAAVTLALILWTRGLFVAGNSGINAFVAEDGKSYYSTPLYCSYSSLYLKNYLSKLRSGYVMTNDRNCCYLADSRNKCCVQTSSTGHYQGCKCDRSITCGMAAGTETTTIVPTVATTTTAPITTTAPTPTTVESTTPVANTPTTTARACTTPTGHTPTTTTSDSTNPRATAALCRTPTFRVLYGESASTDCPNSGVFKVTLPEDDTFSSCNAVFTMATVKGVYKPTIMTAEICKTFIEKIGTTDLPYKIHIGNQTYKLLQPDFTVLSGPSGIVFIDVAENQSHILDKVEACQQNKICPYSESTMQGRVNMTQCKILSWGASNPDFEQNGLNEVALEINNGGCQDPADPANCGSLCFKTRNDKNLMCANDYGAPVYCKAVETEEWALMGITGSKAACDESPQVAVLTHPG